VILAGLVLAAAAALLLAFDLRDVAVTFVALALFDAGLFAAQVANQSRVLAIDPVAPARYNSCYMLVYFVGGSLGTAFGSAAVSWVGWKATECLAACVVLAAVALTAFARGV
jgi:predicted MFS family arabinose efflux permease